MRWYDDKRRKKGLIILLLLLLLGGKTLGLVLGLLCKDDEDLIKVETLEKWLNEQPQATPITSN